jgi:hypothetical protein
MHWGCGEESAFRRGVPSSPKILVDPAGKIEEKRNAKRDRLAAERFAELKGRDEQAVRTKSSKPDKNVLQIVSFGILA